MLIRQESQGSDPERFYSLDALRGLAALAVVLFHWQHFFYDGTMPRDMDVQRLPMYRYLGLVYTHGFLAVDLFFALSGFVFYWLYSARIANREITVARFAVMRLSRLYPLHLVTLIVVAHGQMAYLAAHGLFFVYPNNDAYHFLLNLGLASAWGLEGGASFNAPAWSISVEIVLYAFFFLLCRILSVRFVVLAAVSLAGYMIVGRLYDPMGRGFGAFFLGGCVQLAYKFVRGSTRARSISLLVATTAVALWAVTLYVYGFDVDVYAMCLNDAAPCLQLQRWIVPRVLKCWVYLLLFPFTIMALALVEASCGPAGRRLAVLGDISYSSYLWHFPLQLGFALFAGLLQLNTAAYYSPWTMLCFFAMLLTLSIASHRYFEIPLQIWLRTNWHEKAGRRFTPPARNAT